jgi:tetratricopeptide (TPR) repeat protein
VDEHEPQSIEMDAVTAHLERGWDLLHRGDLSAARVSAQHILKISSDSPDAHTLLGAIAAAEGETEEALELFRQAMALDPDYLDAILFAAELAISPLQDYEAALELCADAEELVLEPEEELDVALLRGEALCGAGCLDEARGLCAARLPGPTGYPAPTYQLRAARILLDLGQPGVALELLEHALEAGERGPELRYYLGIALEQSGEERRATEQFLEVLELERAEVDPGRAPSPELPGQVERAIMALPGELSARLLDRPIKLLELPALELVAEGVDPWATVYLSGIPAGRPPATDAEGGSAPPRRGKMKGKAKSLPKRVAVPEPPADADRGWEVRCIVVYRRNLERVARSAHEISEELKAALEHEARAFFGPTDPG